MARITILLMKTDNNGLAPASSRPPHLNWRQILLDYALITLGAALSGLSYNLFFIPNHIVSGGVSGIAIILNHYFDWPVGLAYLLMNVPLFAAGMRWGGGLTTGVRTVYAIIVSALVIDLTARFIPPVTDNPLLYVAYGGLLDGVGLGLVFRAQGTTGGTDIIARVLRRLFGIEVSRSLFALNTTVIALAALVFGLEKALFGIMVAGISATTVDYVLSGGRRVGQAIIISDRWEAISRALLEDFQRGVTILSGRGAYTGAERPVLLCIVSRSEIVPLRRLIQEIDPDAFVILGVASEVWGEGFRPIDSEV